MPTRPDIRHADLPNPNQPHRTDYYYYNSSWQVLEERTATNLSDKVTLATTVYIQYLWDIRYIDAPVVRFRDANANAGDGLEEALYYCQDANMNVTALVNASDGAVVERYAYDPYGKVTFLKTDWTLQQVTGKTDGAASLYANEVLYCGYRFDPESGLYHVRNRMYQPTVGRWMTRDDGEYVDGTSLYQYVGSAPVMLLDPDGRAKLWTFSGIGNWDGTKFADYVGDLLFNQFSISRDMTWASHGGAGGAYAKSTPGWPGTVPGPVFRAAV